MTETPRRGPFITIEDVVPETAPKSPSVSTPFITIETVEGDGLVRPEPESDQLPLAVSASPKPRRHWLGWFIVLGMVGLALASIADWVIDLVDRHPLLGAPAIVALAALLLGLLGMVIQEVRAVRRLRDVAEVRNQWPGADDERLRTLIIRVGQDLGDIQGAQRAADIVRDDGPKAARRMMSREVLAPRDHLAAQAVALAARQGFVMVTASPSPGLDSLLLTTRSVRLLREIATIYGYRPGALALRSMAIALGRDAGAVAIADTFAEAAAQSASRSMASAGDGLASAGLATAATGAGLPIGIPMALVGIGMSLLGSTVGATGGAVGGGATAAWRLYRFGLWRWSQPAHCLSTPRNWTS